MSSNMTEVKDDPECKIIPMMDDVINVHDMFAQIPRVPSQIDEFTEESTSYIPANNGLDLIDLLDEAVTSTGVDKLGSLNGTAEVRQQMGVSANLGITGLFKTEPEEPLDEQSKAEIRRVILQTFCERILPVESTSTDIRQMGHDGEDQGECVGKKCLRMSGEEESTSEQDKCSAAENAERGDGKRKIRGWRHNDESERKRLRKQMREEQERKLRLFERKRAIRDGEDELQKEERRREARERNQSRRDKINERKRRGREYAQLVKLRREALSEGVPTNKRETKTRKG